MCFSLDNIALYSLHSFFIVVIDFSVYVLSFILFKKLKIIIHFIMIYFITK
jgi:hypothetical protein